MMSMPLYESRIVRFGLVGAVGFVVDYSIFSLLVYGLDQPLLMARGLAFICAATTTWYGNRMITFAKKGRQSLDSAFNQWQKSMCSALVSVVPNMMVFKSIIELTPNTPIYHFIALVGGVLIGMVSNFLLSRYWVFSS